MVEAASSEQSIAGSIRFTPSEQGWIPSLRRIYEFESALVSGPGSWKRDIRECLWSLEDLSEALSLDNEAQIQVRRLVEWLVRNRQALKVPGANGTREIRYLTRIAELVRLLGHTPEYWHRGRPAVEAVRWLVEDKRIPRREIGVQAFVDSIIAAIDKDARHQWKENLKAATKVVVNSTARAIAEKFKERDAAKVFFSRFQLESTIRILSAEFAETSDRPAQVLTAGVGSGKTFAFMVPVLISALARVRSGESQRRSTLLLYPRRALATDQFDVLKRIVSIINNPQLQILFEHYEGYQRLPERVSVKEGLERFYGPAGPPPTIIVTTLETLKRRLQHPLFIGKIASYLNRVIIDEVHLIEGLGGANVVRVMDRLRTACKISPLLWTASSATVASPNEHAAIIFGTEGSKVDVISPAEDDMSVVGLAHHVFLRPVAQLSNLGALVNVTSIMVHNRRDDIGERGLANRTPSIPKTIGFADNLDLLGRWNADFRENERTEESHRMGREERVHPDSPDSKQWKARQREVPYAIRFRKPLQTRIDASGGKSKSGLVYEPVLAEHKGEKLCDRCRNGERVSLGIMPPKDILELSKLVYRRPSFPDDRVESFSIRNPIVFNGLEQEIGTLDLCPYLRAGACYWFPREDELAEKIDTTQRYEFKSVARSKIHSAKTAPTETLSEDLADIVFRASVRDVYDIGDTKANPGIPIDVVLASPSLEVGIDLPNVTESVMFHAIRNVASYRQKAGRIGREEGSDTINASLIANRPIDLHFYRQPRKLVSLAQLDPIPLKATNELVLRCGLYASAWDWLALHANLPEAVSIGPVHSNTRFTQELRHSLDTLRKERSAAKRYLARMSRTMSVDSVHIAEILDQVESEVTFLLSDVREIFVDIEYLSDIIPNLISDHGLKISLKPSIATLFQELHESANGYWQERSKISPIESDLSVEFAQLDLMVRCGWTLDSLKSSAASIKRKLESGLEPRRPIERLLRQLADIEGILEDLGVDSRLLYFFEQFRTFAIANRAQAYYLSFILENVDVFRLLRKRPEYVRIRNLFSNPYEEEVEVSWRGGRRETVPLHEALFSLIPGYWTYRFGKNPVKTKAGLVKASVGGVLTVSLEQLTSIGSQFAQVKRQVPGPPGFGHGFDVIRPTRLEVFQLNEKYLRLNHVSGSVMDGDESEYRSDSSDERFVKIPKTYLNRWVHVDSKQGNAIPILLSEVEYLAILRPDGEIEYKGLDAAKRIRHPLAKSLLSGISWHDELDVTEFLYSCSRTYTSTQVPGVDVVFEGTAAVPLAFGRTIRTEGVSLELDPSLVQNVRQSILARFGDGDPIWAPSIVKSFTAYLTSLNAELSSAVGPFLIRDIVSVVISSLSAKDPMKITPTGLVSELLQLQGDSDELLRIARLQYDVPTIFEENDREAGRIVAPQDSKSQADTEAKSRHLKQALDLLIPNTEHYQEFIDSWIVHALLTSFATAASNAAQRLSGVTDDVIGYAVDFESARVGKHRVYLYDKDAHGNGSTSVVNRFLHILHIQRHPDDSEPKLLPSNDFFDVLEEQLLQCPQHHTDLSALEMLSQDISKLDHTGIAPLGYVKSHAREVLANSLLTWRKLGIRGVEDAWKLPVLRQYVQILSQVAGIEIDDLVRATSICWNGCPECLLNTENVMGGIVGEQLLDKALLDEWFRVGRSRSSEYHDFKLEDISKGTTSLPFGRLSRVVLNLPNRRVRSVALPYTIGLETKRGERGTPVLIVRTSDIDGMSLFELPSSNVTHGIESLGFKRLFWHDLVMTAYLDLLGLLPSSRRWVQAVFFDCRDLSFEDVGVSNRMLDAIMEQAKDDQLLETPERLSDMLGWLAKRGFTVSMCIDKNRLREEGVREFVNRLVGNNCKVVSKDLAGLMHKKAFVTPVGLIEGSANLTQGGTGSNEEIVNYAQYGSQAYSEIAVAVKDTFHGALPVATAR